MGRLNKYITNYIVFDVYQEDVARTIQAKLDKQHELELPELEGEEEPAAIEGDFEESSDEESSKNKSFTKETAHRAKILERMIVQNTLFDYTAGYYKS